MRFDWSTLALQLVNFAILVWLLQRFLYRPVLRLVDARRAALERDRTESARAAAQAKEQRSAIEAQRSGLAAERAAALGSAREEADKLVAARRGQAEREAATLLEEARKTLARERQQALEETRGAAVELAGDMARRVLAELPEPLRMQSWLERIDERLRGLPPNEKARLSAELARGGALRVVTALPLPAAAADSWRARLQDALGAGAVSFETDPALIGGAELRFPHATLGFSVQGAIRALAGEVRHNGEAR
jgi:F-type H+-transporting ATPase subunit b